MSDDFRDPFEALAQPIEPQRPRPHFAADLRARLVADLGLAEEPDPTNGSATADRADDDDLDLSTIPTVDLPGSNPMSATSSPSAATNPTGSPTSAATAGTPRSVATPYLAVRGGVDALAWYAEALGATETFRVVGDDGRLGHAEIDIAGARLMLSDEYPEIGVHSPTGLEGTSVSIHLEVPDVDSAFTRAVAAGATAVSEPTDQTHGSRHGTLVDPYGHRWMLSQSIEDLDLATYAARSEGSGFRVEPGATPPGTTPPGTTPPGTTPPGATQPGATPTSATPAGAAPAGGGPVGGGPGGGEPGIWAGLSYRDAAAGIAFLTDMLGFEVQTLATDPDDATVVVHSELRWPEGGVVQAGTYVDDNEFMQAPGAQAIYVITRDPHAVWERCRAAGVEVVRPPEEPHYDPGGMGFSVRDPEGNILSFGDYAGGA